MFKVVCLHMLRFYQKIISPLLPRACRYYPTCSEFAKEQILKNDNMLFAFYEIIKRLLVCNQIFEGGFDYPLVSKNIKINSLKKNTALVRVKYFYLKQGGKYILIKAI